jgi:hypothetical protein
VRRIQIEGERWQVVVICYLQNHDRDLGEAKVLVRFRD